MTTLYKGQEYFSLDEWRTHMEAHIEETAREIPDLLGARQKKIDNYELYV